MLTAKDIPINDRLILVAKNNRKSTYTDEVIVELENLEQIDFSDYNTIIIGDMWELLSSANKEQLAKLVDKEKRVLATTVRIDFDSLGIDLDLEKLHSTSMFPKTLEFYNIV